MKIQKKPLRYLTKPDKIVRIVRVAVIMHWEPQVLTFHKRWVALLQGSIPSKSCRGLRRPPWRYMHIGPTTTDDTHQHFQGKRYNIGKVISVILSQWLNVSLTISVVGLTPSFSWSKIYCKFPPSSSVFSPLFSPFPGGKHVLARFNNYFHANSMCW